QMDFEEFLSEPSAKRRFFLLIVPLSSMLNSMKRPFPPHLLLLYLCLLLLFSAFVPAQQPAVPSAVQPAITKPSPSPVPVANPDAESTIPRPFVPRSEESQAPPPEPIATAPMIIALPETVPVTSRKFQFRVGYLRADENSMGMDSFKKALETNEAFAKAASAVGIIAISLRPCDSASDMLVRLQQEEFDLAFCPAQVYAEVKILQARTNDKMCYQAVFQQGKPSRGVFFARKGVVQANVADKKALSADLKKLIKPSTLATTDAFNAAGYLYVRRALYDDFNRAEPKAYLFLENSRDVIKTVLSGLCDFGACEETALQEKEKELVQILGTAKPIPASPVLIHEQYAPNGMRAIIGAAASDAAKSFFKNTLTAPDEAAFTAFVNELQHTTSKP
ncbi:TPA: hypothetical protein DDW35_12070, partial [Candidatus Sumerlaeota bacterium]|nr:hypothetical protein [Candidatus Sumerlaeota bacterium]